MTRRYPSYYIMLHPDGRLPKKVVNQFKARFWTIKHLISAEDGVLFFENRLIIPPSLYALRFEGSTFSTLRYYQVQAGSWTGCVLVGDDQGH